MECECRVNTSWGEYEPMFNYYIASIIDAETGEVLYCELAENGEAE